MRIAALLADGLAPGNDEARRWARDELSRPEYQPVHHNWFQRWAETISGWFGARLADLSRLADNASIVIAIMLALAVLAVLIFSLRHVRRVPHTDPSATPKESVLAGNACSPTELRARSEALLAAGNPGGALRAALQALTRRAVDRALLDDLPSLTAHEVSVRLGRRFPRHAPRLADAAMLFDAVVYGNRAVTPAQARSVLDLDAELAATRPVGDADSRALRPLAAPR
ncbi:MAG: DUF4129 domain-containing protein [Gordonia sp. (in: high G+C Gram-positive bacteria)]